MTAELTPGPRNPEILDNYDYPGPSGRLQAPHLCPAPGSRRLWPREMGPNPSWSWSCPWVHHDREGFWVSALRFASGCRGRRDQPGRQRRL